MSDGAKQDPPSLDEFAKRLDAARGDPEPEGVSNRARGVAIGRAFRVGSELLAGLLVGTLLGWGADALFGTKPWLLLTGMLFGFAAGVLNVRRAMLRATDTPESGGPSGENERSGQG